MMAVEHSLSRLRKWRDGDAPPLYSKTALFQRDVEALMDECESKATSDAEFLRRRGMADE